jgi:hypothetical protein
MTPPEHNQVGDKARIESAERYERNGDTFSVRPFGFLESLEVRFAEPVPNMDASKRISVYVEVRHGDGSRIPVLAVLSHLREVKP